MCGNTPFSVRRRTAPLAAVVLLGAAATAAADEFHYNNIRIGDRASGMGGAYTAVSDDTSGSYYNPAGLAYTYGLNLSGSVNAFHVTNTRYKDVLGGEDWVRQSSALVPNFFGVTQPLGKGVVGFSYVVTDSVLEDQDATFRNLPNGIEQYTINFNNKETSYKAGPSYGIELAKGLSVGLTLYGHYREHEQIVNQYIVLPAGAGGAGPTDSLEELSYQQLQSTEYGVEPVLGVMWSPVEKLSLGLSVRQTQILSSNTYRASVCHGSILSSQGMCPNGDIAASESNRDVRRKYPLNATLGVAWFPSRSLLLTGDVSYYGEIYDPLTARTLEATWNVALGGEYYLYDNWAVRAGFFTNNANTPDVVTRHDHVDYLGGTLSVTRFTRSSSLTVGISHAFGEGDGQVFGGGAPQRLESSSTTAFLSTNYNY